MAKYVKVTDNGATGYHSVDDDFEFPDFIQKHEKYEFVSESVARKEHPDLFGDAPVKSTK